MFLRQLQTKVRRKEHTPDPQSVYEDNPFTYFGVTRECSSALLEFAQKVFCFELEAE